MLSSPLQTSSATMDDRSFRIYFEENGHIDHFNFSSNGNSEKFLNHFPSEIRSINFNQMVSNITDENSEHDMFVQHQTRNISSRQIKISESGYPRNIPDLCSMNYNPPKDIQVLIRKGDHNGINSLIKNVSLQQFRQMIGLQRSSGLATINDRKNRHQQSFLPSNIRIINAFKQQENKKLNQQIYSHDTINGINLTSPITTCQETSYFRSNRRTGVANTLHIAIEKCYEQLNYIRDSYAEIESKIGIQMFHKSSSMIDITNTNLSSLSNNPSRVDRLIVEYYYEYNRIIRLHERIQEDLSIQDIQATRQTLDEWFNAINIVQDRRRQEINNATEKCRSDEKDVLQLAEALRILRITTRKIRTLLWYWLYWTTNSTINKIPLIARYQDESNQYYLYDGIYSKNENLFYSSINNDLFDISESNEQGIKKKLILSNENNKENQYNE